MATPSYHLGPCSRITSRSSYILTRTTPSPDTEQNCRSPEVRGRTSKKGHYPRVMESICSKFLLRQKEGWQAPTSTGLLTDKQMDEKEPQRLPPYSPNH